VFTSLGMICSATPPGSVLGGLSGPRPAQNRENRAWTTGRYRSAAKAVNSYGSHPVNNYCVEWYITPCRGRQDAS